MRQPVETGRWENPLSPLRLERVLSVRDPSSRKALWPAAHVVPHQQVEHTAAPTSQRRASKKTLANGEPSTHGEILLLNCACASGRSAAELAIYQGDGGLPAAVSFRI